MGPAPDPFRRARRWFWALVLVAVLSMGALYASLGAPAGPVTALAVAASSLLLLAATAQAARILLALDRVRQRAQSERLPPSAGPAPVAAGTPGTPTGRPSVVDRLLGRQAEALHVPPRR